MSCRINYLIAIDHIRYKAAIINHNFQRTLTVLVRRFTTTIGPLRGFLRLATWTRSRFRFRQDARPLSSGIGRSYRVCFDFTTYRLLSYLRECRGWEVQRRHRCRWWMLGLFWIGWTHFNFVGSMGRGSLPTIWTWKCVLHIYTSTKGNIHQALKVSNNRANYKFILSRKWHTCT